MCIRDSNNSRRVDRPLPLPGSHERGDGKSVLAGQLRVKLAISYETNNPAAQGSGQCEQGNDRQCGPVILGTRIHTPHDRCIVLLLSLIHI